MNKRSMLLYLFLVCAILISACGPTTVVTQEPAVVLTEQPIATATLETVITQPAASATVEPAITEIPVDAGQSWSGTIESLPAGSQFNDQFASADLQQAACGIDGATDEINQLISQYRDSGIIVSIQGEITEDIPDVNGCQIRVSQLTEAQ